ncbi:MAG: Gfo/Idh/MocA family oxidoreductase [Ruthenibacterium sp.]
MLNFAILTAGNIAGSMAETIAALCARGEVNAYAIAARDANRAAAMAQKYGFAKSYGSYDALFADPAVDIVYIASTHNFHAQHARAALMAGKHVLCEKPMTTNEKDAAALFALATERHLVLTEATWTRYQPFVPQLLQTISDGTIGEVTLVTANFGFPLSHVQRMADPALAGGALLDLGIYPLSFAAIVLGGDITRVTSACTKSDRGVDATENITLTMQNGAIASLCSSFLCSLDNNAVIYGDKGFITVPLFWHAQNFTIHLREANTDTVIACPFDFTGYEYEVRSLLRAIARGDTECPELPHAETLRMLRVMDALRADWGVKYPFE